MTNIDLQPEQQSLPEDLAPIEQPDKMQALTASLDVATSRVAQSLVGLEAGLSTDEEADIARQAIGQFGSVLQAYIEERLDELALDGVSGTDIGQAIEELSAKVEILHGTILGDVGAVSEVSRAKERLRVNKFLRMVGGIALGGAAGLGIWAASKGVDIGMDRINMVASATSAWASERGIDISDKVGLLAPVALMASGTMKKGGGTVAKNMLGRAKDDLMDPDDVHRMSFIQEYEDAVGEELKDDEKVAISYWLEASDDTDDLRQEMRQYVGEQYMNGNNLDTPEAREAASIALTAMALNHISRLYGLDSEGRIGVSEAVRDAAAETAAKMTGGGDPIKEMAKALAEVR